MNSSEEKVREKETDGIRINRFLGMAGVCSRREADRMIEQGRISIDGRRAQAGDRVFRGSLVCVDGSPVRAEEKDVILAVNKPKGVVCTTDRRWGDPLLEDLVQCPGRVFPVGRLDKDSEGLILMTNRGDLAEQIMRSYAGHEKEYVVTVNRDITRGFLERLGSGVYLEGLERTTAPCKVRKTGDREFHIILTQGLNRQIRRMCEAFDYHVVSLIRIRVMNVRLDGLKSGHWRYLTEREEKELIRML